MSDSAKLAAVKEATERVREGLEGNASGERSLDIASALMILCDAVDELADVLGAAPAEAIERPDVDVDTVAHPPPAPPDLYPDHLRCEATIEDGERYRCELKRGHRGRHRAQRNERASVQWRSTL